LDGKEKQQIEFFLTPENVKTEVFNAITKNEIDDLYGHMKEEYSKREDTIKERILELFKDNIENEEMAEWTKANVLDSVKATIKKHMRKNLIKEGKRLDGRSPHEVRKLVSKVDVLPRPHGSAMFMRGDTQALSVVTLGSPGDAQIIDEMDEERASALILTARAPWFEAEEQ